MDLAYLDFVTSPHTPYNTTTTQILAGTELGVVGYDDPVYRHRLKIIKHRNGTVQFAEGMCYDLLVALQMSLNFKYRAVEGNNWWGIFPNKTVFGMTGQVVSGEAELCIGQASMVMMMDALDYISYLIPTSSGRLTFIFQQPRSTKDILCAAFSYQIWICWLLVWICIATSWVIVNRVWSKFYKANSNYVVSKRFSLVNESDACKTRLESRMHFCTELFLWCFTTMCLKGWHKTPKEFSAKGVLVVGMGFAYVISIFYSASLTSNLATETIPIKTFNDLAMSELQVYGDKRLPLVSEIVKDVYLKTRKTQFKNEDAMNSHFIRVNQSLQTIITSSSAFITFEDAAKSVSSREGYSNAWFCNSISALSVSNMNIPTAMFVRKNSPLREIFNRKILALIERGIVFRLNSIYNRKTLVTCSDSEDHYRGGLGFPDLSLTYFIAFSGIILCFGVLLLEKCIAGFNNSQSGNFAIGTLR